MKLLHVSDLHFHMSNSKNKKALAVLGYIKENYPDHYLVVTGDIVDDGHPVQYEKAFKALKQFKGRIFICPGNHDFGAAGNFYSRERAARFDEYLSEPLAQGGTFLGDHSPVVNVVEDGDVYVALIALDTNLETNHPFDFACGEVGDTQLQALETILKDRSLTEAYKVVFFHHHPFIHRNPFLELQDARTLMRMLYKNADCVLFGHKHVSEYWENMNGIDLISASDNSPGKDWARQIEITKKGMDQEDVRILPS